METKAPTQLRIFPSLSSISQPLVIRQPEAKPIADNPRQIWEAIATRHLVRKASGSIRKIFKP